MLLVFKNFMKKSTFLIVVLFFYLFNNFVAAQEKFTQKEISKIAYAEKIYIQLNSTVFTNDQTIWFKAIATDVNQKPTILSKVLHVDLINFDKKIVDSKLLKLKNGIADGFFDLQEAQPLPPGKYMIRAYTRWNTNFKENFISKQYIDIYKTRKTRNTEKAIRNVVISEKENKQKELSAKVFPTVINPKFRGKLKIYVTVDDKKDSIIIKKNKEKEYVFNYLLPKNTVQAKIDVQLDSVRIKNRDFKVFNSFSKTIVIDKNHIDLQFFPEGGKLVNGLTSFVGFKALDYKNEGIPVEGVIKDENGFKIIDFKSNQLGMGFYQLKPDIKKSYHAEVLIDKKTTYKFQLPKIYKKGYVLTAKTTQSFFKLQLRSNFSKTDSLYVKVQARGITYFNTKVLCKNGMVKMAFKKSLFPEGIVTFTAFNKLKHPICERLVFNYKEDSNRVKIIAKADKKKYQQRDKVVFDIEIKDNLNTNTSFLVLNKKQLGEMQLKRGNILSYFLLESELKGTIEQPNFYFEPQNKQRFYALDALLLSQGWRNYIFKPTNEKIEFKNQPEKSLQISGSIEEYAKRKRKRKKPIELTLMAKGKKDIQANVTTMDSLGKFSFKLRDTYTKDLEYIIQTKNHRGRKKELTINIDKPKPLKIDFNKQETLQLAEKYSTYIAENRKRFIKENPFSVDKNGFVLDEVVVKTRLLSPIQKKMTDEHGEPDVIIEEKELISKNEKWMSGLYSLLQSKFPDDIIVTSVPNPMVFDNKDKTVLAPGTDLGFTLRNGTINNIVDFSYSRKPPITINAESFLYAHVRVALFTFIIIDGIPVHIRDYPLVPYIDVNEIKSVEIIKKPKYPATYFENVFNEPQEVRPSFAFLNIYSHAGKGLYGITETKGIFKNTLPSFSFKKEFYAPKYEKLTKKNWEVPDLRSTVFWQPEVKLDNNGKANVEFYTDDNIGEMMVIIESITNDGKLNYYETSYEVKKKSI